MQVTSSEDFFEALSAIEIKAQMCEQSHTRRPGGGAGTYFGPLIVPISEDCAQGTVKDKNVGTLRLQELTTAAQRLYETPKSTR